MEEKVFFWPKSVKFRYFSVASFKQNTANANKHFKGRKIWIYYSYLITLTDPVLFRFKIIQNEWLRLRIWIRYKFFTSKIEKPRKTTLSSTLLIMTRFKRYRCRAYIFSNYCNTFLLVNKHIGFYCLALREITREKTDFILSVYGVKI